MTTYPYSSDQRGAPAAPTALDRPARRRRRRGVRHVVVGVVLLALVLAAVLVWRSRTSPFLGDECQATVSGRHVSTSPEQMGNAATIAGVAVRRGLPARAATIAIATAIQESKLQNVDYGDRDSLGLFQQRPSQGWGTTDQVRDPVHASNAFYDALVKVKGYQSLPITQVAQRVQRSAYPEAYADHEPDARVLASALTGYSPAALSCTLDPKSRPAGADGVDPFRNALRAEVTTAAVTRVSPQAGGRPTGLRVALPDARRRWAVAQWSVAQADRLGVARIVVAGRQWTRAASKDGWTTVPDDVPDPSGAVTVMFTADAPRS